ncbi:MAG: hypothetical protein B7X37_05300 [Halothiobacillus sp. 14-55-98]|nr:MAG: hypothetical protein B7X37_05300 [Halothiobacillus sp. 14-55-98]
MKQKNEYWHQKNRVVGDFSGFTLHYHTAAHGENPIKETSCQNGHRLKQLSTQEKRTSKYP